MNEWTDQQLVREYTGRRSEAAFAELVRRHIDLVYSAALRMVCDSHLAQDVTQNTFLVLANKARQLSDRPVLSGWLHRTAQNLASKTVRTDVRRRMREQEAAAMNELLAESGTGVPPVWCEIAPHLDEALSELSEPDRDALLLRYFERKSAREMAHTLGISDEAAQKRVNRAVERLRDLFVKRGLTVGSSGLVVAITTHAVQAAPAGLALTISTTTALAGTTIAATATTTATQTIAMTTLQKTIIGATLAAAIGAGIYEARRAARLKSEVQSLQEQLVPADEQAREFRRQRDDAMARLAALQEENDRLRQSTADIPRLRGEIARFRRTSDELSQFKAAADQSANDPAEAEMRLWLARVDQLKHRLELTPQAGIPELQFITEQDWLNAAKQNLETEEDYRRALSKLRNAAENKFVPKVQPALKKYAQANNNQFPTDLSQLKPYFDVPVDDAVLQRYSIVPAKELPNMRMGGDWIITQTAPVDAEYDGRSAIGLNGYGSSGPGSWSERQKRIDAAASVLAGPLRSYTEANNGNEPADPAQLRPYVTTAEQRQALETLLQVAPPKTQATGN